MEEEQTEAETEGVIPLLSVPLMPGKETDIFFLASSIYVQKQVPFYQIVVS
jgi:hypothetical protein